MLIKILYLSILVACSCYPLYYWLIITKSHLKKFFKKQIYPVNFVGAACVIFTLIQPYPLRTKISVLFWKACLFISLRYRDFFAPYFSGCLFIIMVICVYVIQETGIHLDSSLLLPILVVNFLVSYLLFNSTLKNYSQQFIVTEE